MRFGAELQFSTIVESSLIARNLQFVGPSLLARTSLTIHNFFEVI